MDSLVCDEVPVRRPGAGRSFGFGLVVLVVVFAVPLAIVAEQSCSGSAAAGSSDKPLDLAPEPRPSRRY